MLSDKPSRGLEWWKGLSLKRRREYLRKHRSYIKILKEKGLCIDDGREKVVEGHLVCARHLRLRRLRGRKRYQDFTPAQKRSHYLGNVKYRKDNKERLAEIRNQRKREVKRETLNAYGGKCICCGEARLEFLTLHHVDGGGAKHRKKIGSWSRGGAFYRWLKKRRFPKVPRLVVECMNCHLAIDQYGYCPHKKKT